jgi:hypothetical protein
MLQERQKAIVLHTISEIVEDNAVADAWAFADDLYKRTNQPHSDAVATYNGYAAQIVVSPPQGATTISVWSPSLRQYVTIYSDDGLISVQSFPEAWPAELPLIRPET